MDASPIIVWLRRDVRLADNPALAAAAAGPVVLLYILEDGEEIGGAARWWLHRSLADLGRRAPLLLRRGEPARVLTELAAETKAAAVHWNRRYSPAGAARDRAAAAALVEAGIAVRDFPGDLLFEPWTVRSRAGAPFRVFTPFWNRCQEHGVAAPVAAPDSLRGPSAPPGGDSLDSWRLPPDDSDWMDGLAAAWRPGEDGAAARLADFVDESLGQYATARDRPDQPGTSRLSPHLSFGEIGPRQLRQAVGAASLGGGEPFLRQLGWREFAWHLLHHAPDMDRVPLRPEFARFPWRSDDDLFEAWCQGRTGYPIVDAGMRCLWRTGWMHNRVRMIAASFLVKDLLMPWQRGAAWFLERLVDADLAINAASWQWVAGCGTDAAPYFRIFNPVLQGEKFDPRGRFVRQWVPELAGLPDLTIHRPWQAAPAALAKADITLGQSYPPPVVDHGAARRRALLAYEQARGAA